jgi:uncharacterized membrane protein YgcG
MTAIPPSSSRVCTRLVRFACAVALLAAFSAWPSAQAPAKKPLAVDDYTKWRSIAGQEISGDGRWVAYTLQLMNTVAPESKPVLHLRNLVSDEEVTVEHATGGTFSPDSKWIAYQVDPGAAQRARAGRGGTQGGTPPPGAPATPPPSTPPSPPPPATGPPGSGAQPATPAQGARGGAAAIPPRRVELRNLETGEVRSWQDIGSFTFAPTSTHLFMRRRPAESAGEGGGRGAAPGGPGGGGRGGGAGAPASQDGLDVILLDLGTGRHQLLGSVNDIAFNRTGELLAYTVESPVKDANGLFVFDTRSDRIVPLDNDAKQYRRLTWNEDGNAIAVLKGLEVEKMRERDNVLVAFTNIPALLGRRPTTTDEPALPSGPSARPSGAAQTAHAPIVLDPATTDPFPKGWVISERAAMAWSEDNRRVFFGIKEQAPAPDTNRRSTDEAADVDIWNTSDERVQSAQMTRAEADRNFTFRQAFDVADGRFIRLADETMRDLEVSPDGRWAIGRDTRGYIHDFNPSAADLYRVDTTTGERTVIAKNQLIGSHVFGITPHGRHFLYWKDQKYQAYDLEAGASRTLGGGAAVNFTNTEFDRPGPKPAYGIAGHASDGTALVVNHRYDLWLLPLDGTAPKNLTGGAGAKAEMRLRIVRTEPVDETVHRAEGPRGTIDLSKPLTLSAYGEYTKKAGFYELAGGQLKELVYEDAAFSTPARAADADTYVFRRETFNEYPDLLVSGPASATRRRSATRTRTTPSTCGAAGCCSTTGTGTASASRASSRCPTTTSRASGGR